MQLDHQLGIMSFPRNSKLALKMLYKTCDDMWRASNDKSTDFSFYTKRLVLSGVYTKYFILLVK